MSGERHDQRAIGRRTVLRASVLTAAVGMVPGCYSGTASTRPLVLPGDGRIAAVDSARHTTGRVRRVTLEPVAGQVDLGGPVVHTWTYGGQLPGREIRVRTGDIVDARLVNALPADTSIHWHGVELRNDMDGAPHVTQDPVPLGSEFRYRFIAANPGTYWFHPHSGVQLDRGLYATLIVEDSADTAAYDHDWTVILDDWIDGAGATPEEVLTTLRTGMSGMGHRSGPASRLLRGHAGDVDYPHYLINGRIPNAPRVFRARPGQRVRIRFVNAGADTAFRVALGGHRLTITHTDGFPVAATDTDALLIGMGERYDVVVTLDDGVFPLVALAEGKNATAFALVRTAPGIAPTRNVRPRELDRQLARYADLHPGDDAALQAQPPDTTHRLLMQGGMMSYEWQFAGQHDSANPLRVSEGQRVRLELVNATMMWHPIHLHGHTFQVGDAGPRKDTAIVLPGQAISCDFDATNPGQWMVHCHNAYHAATGMMAVVGYESA